MTRSASGHRVTPSSPGRACWSWAGRSATLPIPPPPPRTCSRKSSKLNMPSETEVARLVLGLQPVREAIRRHREALQEVLVDRRDQPRLEALARFATDQG